MMRQVLQNNYLVMLARAVLGVLFIVASADKVSDPTAFAVTVESYKLLSHNAALVVATVLPWMELICGVLLVLGVFHRGAGLLLFGLLVVFTVAVVSALVRGLDISCGCFTQDPNAAKIGWLEVVENLALIGLSLLVTLSQSSWLSIENM
ncbi:MAG: MauE/DoxX family redox-associated membrane protein, partial [Bacteroidota bacterium]